MKRAFAALSVIALLSVCSNTHAEDVSKAEVLDCSTVTPVATVNMREYSFDPETVSIKAGDVVKWTNIGSVSHSVASYSIDSEPGAIFYTGLIRTGKSKCIRFTEPGTYTYLCKPHSKKIMEGMVLVQ